MDATTTTTRLGSRCGARVRLRAAFHEIELGEGSHTMGRDSECAFTIDDSLVSRVHAVLHVDASGVVFVFDLASRNGTFVNGARLKAGLGLRDGDRLRVGTSEFEVAIIDDLSRSTQATIATIACARCARQYSEHRDACPDCGAPKGEAGRSPAANVDRPG